jgi:DNA-binding transcriptional ArsR family regulator
MLTTERLDAMFFALSDPTRREIVARLANGEATVNELVEPFDISQPAISRHLKVLEQAGLISRGRDAQRRPCRLEKAPMEEINLWIARIQKIWEANYVRLDSLLDGERKARGARRPGSAKV